jgi:hypothetical protein
MCALCIHLDAPLPHPHLYPKGALGTTMYQQGECEEKKWLYRNLVVISPPSLQIPMQQGAYRCMGWAVRECIGTDFLVAWSTSKQMPSFWSLIDKLLFLELKGAKALYIELKNIGDCLWHMKFQWYQCRPVFSGFIVFVPVKCKHYLTYSFFF